MSCTKRIIAVIIAVVLSLAFCGCRGTNLPTGYVDMPVISMDTPTPIPEQPDVPDSTTEQNELTGTTPEDVEATPELTATPTPEPTADSMTFYLSFDDGPYRGITDEILDVLELYGVKATFFTVGYNVKYYPDLVKRIQDEGHLLGCHSYSHEYDELYASAENFSAEIDQWEAAIQAAGCTLPEQKVFRFPGGSSQKNAYLRPILEERGYHGYDWSALSNDCLIPTEKPEDMSELDYVKQSLTESIEYSLSKGDIPHIILSHDVYSVTAEVLPWLIEYIEGMGYHFCKLDALDDSWYYGNFS